MHPHLNDLTATLNRLEHETARVRIWGRKLAGVLDDGGRLLACGNGGSAAEAQHLTAELVGRFRADRRPYAAIALHADTSSTTAIVNDYGPEEVFARQVRAHGRPGDVLIALSTSGASSNVLAAARAARDGGLMAWALTGPPPNELADLCDDAISVFSSSPCVVQEVHLVLVHLLCEAIEEALS
ncbi:SIS domain-containing protein [Herbidospora sp. NBRC 101105]|uniref:D-sedoheptulose-7-phosphate isomerase n=1 Tax=Herbidospora sp. NBRC 101105 TaxID=3032195 RepID=UPI0024A055B4|nr:SIS domain-containing protein [Herbidospora sp. NBRC 101105]GLX95110.1 phosphoheptose isomerase [Herbidospora sp. NBRC 101105]